MKMVEMVIRMIATTAWNWSVTMETKRPPTEVYKRVMMPTTRMGTQVAVPKNVAKMPPMVMYSTC
jgi:hypothetical protein